MAPAESTTPRPQGGTAPIVFNEKLPATPLRLAKAVSAAVSPGSPFGQEFRILAAKMRSMGESKALRVIGVVSATGGEGKTTISIGLAAAMSDPGRKVLLMECDLRKPAIEKYLGLERVEGLGEWLGGSGSIAPTRRVASLGFSLLSAGRSPANAELLGTDRMAHMLQSARRSFDWVVVDCPPLAPVADSVVLQDMLDGFLLVVRTRHTPIETIQRAVSHVKPERIQGIVVNGHRELLHSYYNYGYRYYGEID